MQEALKKKHSKIRSCNWYPHVILIVEKGSTGGICHSIYQYTKANDKYMKNVSKNKEWSYFQYWDVNNLCG